MSYLKTARNRRLKFRLSKFLDLFKFKYISFNIYSKIIFVWSLISIFSLFLPWAKVNNDILILAFWNILWNIAYFILLLNLLLLFFLVSNRLKESIKLNINIVLKDRYLILYLSVFNFILSIISFRFLFWISHFYQDIDYWRWIILFLVWSIILLVWAYLENRNLTKKSIVNFNNSNNISSTNDTMNTDENMKLPF